MNIARSARNHMNAVQRPIRLPRPGGLAGLVIVAAVAAQCLAADKA